jgi:putative ABC transport system ATP-binding protein/macrolide transport system ATP-binding/permease protein/lipoprotein-releasing system ATP-binding protein
MMNPAIIETREVSLTYHSPRGPITAVDRVSLAIAPGECVAIMGRSGSGKSTLLALLGGLCTPTSGEVLLADCPWTARSPREQTAARARGVGLLLQDGGLLPGLRALDNVLLPAVLAGRSHASAAARAEELLRLVGIGERWDAYPAELSGGQQRRVALARALAAEPAVILADEPTGDLDGLAAHAVTSLFERLRAERSTAIVVVTHDSGLAAIADRRLWMERGRCTAAAEHAMPPVAPPVAFAFPPALAGETVFEAAPEALEPAEPASGIGDAARAWVPFLIGVVATVAGVALIDGLVARRQQAVVQAARAQRRLAEEMALQDLRADIDDVVVHEDVVHDAVNAAPRATVTLFLQNYRPERPLHVLGPTVEIGIQRGGGWESIPIDLEYGADGIRTVGSEKTLLPVAFTVPEGGYDELLRGYLHVRIGAAMVVSDRPDGTGDLFERQDAYYLYLRDPRRTEAEIRDANGWGDKATVPLWIAMPSH